MRIAELEMHPLDTLDRRDSAQEDHGLGYCNITKCCTEVCPEHIKITDNAIIPMKERVVDNKYDPLVWLGRKIFRRDQLESSSENMAPSTSEGVTGAAAGTPQSSSRGPAGPVLGEDGKLDVAELLSDRPGGPSPFGDEQTFPLPTTYLSYQHPE